MQPDLIDHYADLAPSRFGPMLALRERLRRDAGRKSRRTDEDMGLVFMMAVVLVPLLVLAVVSLLLV